MKKNIVYLFLAVLLILSVGLLATAGHASTDNTRTPLVVVKDYGSESATPYFEAINGANETQQTTATPSIRYDESAMLPVISDTLSVGKVTFRPLNIADRSTSFFLVGVDKHSIGWLKRWSNTLQQTGALGLVVNVKTLAQLNELRRLFPALELRPTDGDDLAKRLNLQHYPVLISYKGIQQ